VVFRGEYMSMAGERIKGEYQQKVYDIIHMKGCVKRFVIVDEIAKEYNLPKERAEYVVKYSLKVLTKLGIVKKVGSGFYCVEGRKVE